jgi:hypothetical protein
VGKIHRGTVAVKTKFLVTRTVRICKVSITGGQKENFLLDVDLFFKTNFGHK